MANRKFSTLPDTAVQADLIGSAVMAADDLVASLTKQVPLAVLRRALFAGGTGYTANDPLQAGNTTITGTFAVSGAATFASTADIAGLAQFRAGVKLGVDATGTDAAATGVDVTGPLGSGTGTPAFVRWLVGVQGSSGSTPQTATEAFRVQEVANATAREVAAWNVTGPVMGLMPLNANALGFFEASDGGRFANRVKINRIGNGPLFAGTRGEGSFASPTPPLANSDLFFVSARPVVDAATGASAVVGTINFRSRVNLSTTDYGSLIRFAAAHVGTTVPVSLLDLQGGGTNITEMVSVQPTLRLIPGATQFAIRDSGNTADTFTVNAAGTAITAPLLTSLTHGVQASGTNTAASDLTITGPLSTGNATPAALLWRVGVQGASGSTAQTATEAFRVSEIANATGRFITAENVNGPISAGVASVTSTALRSADDRGFFFSQLTTLLRNGGPTSRVFRANGAANSPTHVLSGEDVGYFSYAAYAQDGTQQVVARIAGAARENVLGTGNRGGRMRFQAAAVGAAGLVNLYDIQSGGAGIAEFASAVATLRIISGATQIAFRDSGNTADTFTVNAAGTAAYFPIATAVGVGTSSNNAAAILQADSTTRGFLPPRMTTAQKNAISTPPAGLVVYDTDLAKLCVYTTAWETITSA